MLEQPRVPDWIREFSYPGWTNIFSLVLASMPRVEWVACLGKESWFLTCTVLGDPFAANQFGDSRKHHKPVTGVLGEQSITAFPLYHPAALGDALKDNEMAKGWRAFATLVSNRQRRRLEIEDPNELSINVN